MPLHLILDVAQTLFQLTGFPFTIKCPLYLCKSGWNGPDQEGLPGAFFSPLELVICQCLLKWLIRCSLASLGSSPHSCSLPLDLSHAVAELPKRASNKQALKLCVSVHT